MLPNQKPIRKQQPWKFSLAFLGYTIWYLKLLEIVCQRWELWWCWWSLPPKAFQDNSQVQLLLSLSVNFGYNLFKSPAKLTKLCWAFLPAMFFGFFFLRLKSFNNLSRRIWRALFFFKFSSNKVEKQRTGQNLKKNAWKNVLNAFSLQASVVLPWQIALIFVRHRFSRRLLVWPMSCNTSCST